MKLEIKEEKKIEDGTHEGIITAVEYRTKPFDYTDLVIEFNDGLTIKYGVPTTVTMTSKLGKLLIDFGASLEVGGSIDPDEVFPGKRCTFMTMNEKTKRGTFAKVVNDSVRPIKDEEVK